MRLVSLSLVVPSILLIAFGIAQSKPLPKDKKEEPAPTFKPLEISAELNQNDSKDPKIGNPSKKYTVKLAKDRTYVIDLDSKDFDSYLRLLDKAGNQLAEDDDGGGDLNSRIIHSPAENGDHQVIVTTFDAQLGKFSLKVRELKITGNAKPFTLEKKGFEHAGNLAQNDKTDLGKLTKVVSVQLKAGQSYLFEIDSEDFDCQIYVFDGKNRLLGQDLAKVICAVTDNAPVNLVVASFDGQVGKFNLKVREFTLKGEAKPREIGKDGISIMANINKADETAVAKLGKVYSVQLKAGQNYTIDLASPTMDSYVYLFDGKSKLLAEDDDTGGDLNSRISFRAERDGIYHILASTLDGDETGAFTLKVRKGE
ncbi:MAG: hypothetical protein EXR98_03385 [Gemmataceae bacterium]|nr:hypothetical protein [Gemmataceae bacterium]